MSGQLKDLAWKILLKSRDLTPKETAVKEHLLSLEETRLRALNQAFLVWNDHTKRVRRQLRFGCLTYRSITQGLSHDAVHVDETVEFPPEIRREIANLKVSGFIELLTHIHSLGCYRLPAERNLSTLQRDLGAYYTPSEVATFITRKALDRVLRNHTIGSFPRILDPACGTGVFLLSAYSHLKSTLRSEGIDLDESPEDNEMLLQSLYGVDLDGSALEIAKAGLVLASGVDADLSKNLLPGNSIITLNGLDGASNHIGFFDDPSRTCAFEWRREFSEVFSTGGFDCVLMNPPYERLKPNLAEFLRERLLSGEKRIHMEQFANHKNRIREHVNYYRNSGEYSFSNKFTINTYRLFIERAMQLLREGGVVGCIVPSTLLGDQSSQSLRRELLERNSMHSVHEFPESSQVFTGVTQSVSVMVVSKGGQTEELSVSYDLRDLDNAKESRPIHISTDQLLPSLVIPRLSRDGWRVLSMLKRYPTLSETPGAQVWRGELDLTLNKRCIIEAENEHPLIRGSDISRFRLTEDGREQFVDFEMLKEQLGKSERIRHVGCARIATQQVSNMSQRWRLKCAPIPSSTVIANSCNYIVLDEGGAESPSTWYLLGVLNSELLNWRFHASSFNNHISVRELQSLPIPPPSKTKGVKLQDKIARQAQALSHNTDRETTQLDAMVFSLYGLDSKTVSHILTTRGTPSDVAEEILNMMKEHV